MIVTPVPNRLMRFSAAVRDEIGAVKGFAAPPTRNAVPPDEGGRAAGFAAPFMAEPYMELCIRLELSEMPERPLMGMGGLARTTVGPRVPREQELYSE